MLGDTDSIDQKRRRLAGIEKDRLVELLAKLWVSVEAFLDDAVDSGQTPTNSKSTNRSDVKLTKAWTAILGRLSTYKHFRGTDIVLVSRELQKNGSINRIQTPGSARAQLSHLTRKGMIKRLGGGNYCVTEQTKAVLGQSRR